MFRKTLPLTLVSVTVAACSSGAPEVMENPGKYRGYDVQVSAPGDAVCAPLSQAEISHAVSVTNAFRAKRGLAPLTPNAKMSKIASQQACHMAKTGMMSHAGPSNEGPKQRARAAGYKPMIIAENIAAGPYDLDRTLGAWSASAGHIGNMSLPQVRDFGIGVATGADGSRYWAAVYAAGK